LVSEMNRDAVLGKRPHFLDEPVVQLLGPLTREERNDFVSSANELRSVPPAGIDRVRQSYFCRIASIPSIFGEAHLLHRTVARERRERGAGERRCYSHDFFSLD